MGIKFLRKEIEELMFPDESKSGVYFNLFIYLFILFYLFFGDTDTDCQILGWTLNFF